MSVIMGRGSDAKKAIENGGGQDKLDFVRLKAGQSIKVRILSNIDYVAYKAHGHFTNGIYTQPCIKATGERCLLCEAAAYDGELVGDTIGTVKTQKGDIVSEWSSMYAKKRVLFAFVNLDEDVIQVFDATKNQADGLIATIDEYGEDLDDMAFTLKRTGEKNETSYTLNPILPKKMAEIQEVFDKYDGQSIEDKVFEDSLQARTLEEMAMDLKKGGFPVKEVFGIDVKADGTQAEAKEEGEPIEGETIDLKDEDLPF